MTRLLIHDTLVTSPWARAGRDETAVPVEARETLAAVDLGADDAAFLPAGELLDLHHSHRVVPDVAVVAGTSGTIRMRVPVRPDEIERSAVYLSEATRTAELLARALLRPFYGIVPTGWTREPAIDAQVVVLDGIAALEPPEAGFVEDLCRAWLILTDTPVVSHVLVVPMTWDRVRATPVLESLATLRAAGHRGRRDIRAALVGDRGIDRDALADLLTEHKAALEPADRRALLMLLQLGTRGSDLPRVPSLTFLDDPGPDAVEDV